MNRILQKFLVIPSMFLLTSCVWNTSIKGEMLLENRFVCRKEFEGETQIEEKDRWFTQGTTIYTTKNETYSMVIKYKDATIPDVTITGSYHLEVISPGHSGTGWITIDENKIDLTFERSYFLIFKLPTKYNPHEETTVRTIHLQRW